MQNVQFNLKQKQIFNFVMQGKCQKLLKYKKNCKFSALFSGISTMLLFLPGKTGHTAKKPIGKRPNSYLPVISWPNEPRNSWINVFPSPGFPLSRE
jgi:hypothetical protein